MALSYTYTGIFVFSGCSLNPKRIKNDINSSLVVLKENRKTKIPRPLSRSLLIVVYLVETSDESILDYLKITKFRGQGWSAHFLLYQAGNSSVIFREAVQNETLAIYKTMERLFDKGVGLCENHLTESKSNPRATQ